MKKFALLLLLAFIGCERHPASQLSEAPDKAKPLSPSPVPQASGSATPPTYFPNK
jgi:hypothetical protein